MSNLVSPDMFVTKEVRMGESQDVDLGKKPEVALMKPFMYVFKSLSNVSLGLDEDDKVIPKVIAAEIAAREESAKKQQENTTSSIWKKFIGDTPSQEPTTPSIPEESFDLLPIQPTEPKEEQLDRLFDRMNPSMDIFENWQERDDQSWDGLSVEKEPAETSMPVETSPIERVIGNFEKDIDAFVAAEQQKAEAAARKKAEQQKAEAAVAAAQKKAEQQKAEAAVAAAQKKAEQQKAEAAQKKANRGKRLARNNINKAQRLETLNKAPNNTSNSTQRVAPTDRSDVIGQLILEVANLNDSQKETVASKNQSVKPAAPKKSIWAQFWAWLCSWGKKQQ